MTLTHFLPFAELKIYIGLRKKPKPNNNNKNPLLQTGSFTHTAKGKYSFVFWYFFFNSYIKLHDYKPLLSSLYFPMLEMTKQNVTKEI